MAFNIFRSERSEEFYFNLQAKNGEIILQSKGYKTEPEARKIVDDIIFVCQTYKINNFDIFERAKSKDGLHYFKINSPNLTLLGFSETYNSKQAMIKGIKSVIKNAKNHN